VLQNKPPLIYGNGEQTRDYTYISDVINAYDLILKTKGNPGKNGINFGWGSEVSVNKIAEVIIDKSEINNNQKLKPKYIESHPYNHFQIYLTKQFKFSVNTIFTLWMTGLPRSGKPTIAKNLGKENKKMLSL
jgi:nucleoside-diphosphate-sugar epimerase